MKIPQTRAQPDTGCAVLAALFCGAMATGGCSFTTISGPWGGGAGGWSGPAVKPQAQDLTVGDGVTASFFCRSACGWSTAVQRVAGAWPKTGGATSRAAAFMTFRQRT